MTVNRVRLGLSSGAPVFKVSRPGYDVTGSLTVDQVSFDLSWLDMAQIWEAGTATVDSGTSVSYINGTYWRLASFSSQGFIPLVLVWKSGQSQALMWTRALYVDATSVWVGANVYEVYPLFSFGAPTGTYKYAVLKTPVTP